MSDRMTPIPFAKLLGQVLREFKAHGSIFGVDKFYRFPREEGKLLPIFREKLEAPFGPAAGPHTQLAQNIITAYLCGARFFELKTVQIIDGEALPVAKPCIASQDECYNCEWSTELTVPQALEEYIKAYFICKLLAKELALGNPDAFVFNMSVGYDLAGIKSPKLDGFIEGLKNAEVTAIWRECKVSSQGVLKEFSQVNEEYISAISPNISSSITLSTLHGCPPEEIERIATYLIVEKHLNTYVKCNPTLLGYDFARATVDSLGYTYLVFDEHHFKEDLQLTDAIPMIKRLQALAENQGLEFGVKLTNTFPVMTAAGELPSEEMYMSGRALFPLTSALAAKLAGEFQGKLRISYSGGADYHNIKELFTAGIWPVTLASTLLKPGGYERLFQLAQTLSGCEYKAFNGVNTKAVAAIAKDSLTDKHYQKPAKLPPTKKLAAKVPLLDCFTAPCMGGCPFGQDVPAYLKLCQQGKYYEALQCITERNPLPFITGTICAHHCMDKCTRGFYEGAISIRGEKLKAAKHAFTELLSLAKPTANQNRTRVAIVGGGVGGIATAYLLAKHGASPVVFEREKTLGGVVKQVIPEFRIPTEAIEKDISLAVAVGVEFKTGCEIRDIKTLLDADFQYVVVANGAPKSGELTLKGKIPQNAIEFLKSFKSDKASLNLGEKVAIIGGGNTAMDAARAALRVNGVKQVNLVYRRDVSNMPADLEELELAMEEGVKLRPLLAPVEWDGASLVCHKMVLGGADSSGRRAPIDTGEQVSIDAHSVIAAVGERSDGDFFTQNNMELDAKGNPKLDKNQRSALDRVFVIGDAAKGPATVAEAIADGWRVTEAICGGNDSQYHSQYGLLNINPNMESVVAKRGKLYDNGDQNNECGEGERCLECATLCRCCVEVCPNRANILLKVEGVAMPQILHIDAFCNECGNCQVFCPYDSAPYKEKFTLFATEGEFEGSENDGFLPQEGKLDCYRVRVDGRVYDYSKDYDSISPEIAAIIKATAAQYNYIF